MASTGMTYDNKSDYTVNLDGLDRLEEYILKKTSLDQQIAVDKLQHLDVLELVQILKILQKELGYIELENSVLENFLLKSDPKALQLIAAAIEIQLEKVHGKKIQFDKDIGTDSARSTAVRSHSAVSIKSKPSTQIGSVALAVEWKLNYSIKNDFTEKLMTELNKDYDDKKKRGIKELRETYSKIDELHYRINDTEGTIRGFKKNVVDISYNQQTGILPTEKFLRYFKNWITNATALVSTMKLRIHTVQDSCQSIRTLIVKKKDLGGLITEVDFEATQLKKIDYLRILEDRNENILKIKQANSKASNALIESKNMLIEIEHKWKKISDKISNRKIQMEKIELETIGVENEITNVRGEIEDLVRKTNSYTAPSIEEYIEMKIKLAQLEKVKNAAMRKNQLLRLQVKTKKQVLKMNRNKNSSKNLK